MIDIITWFVAAFGIYLCGVMHGRTTSPRNDHVPRLLSRQSGRPQQEFTDPAGADFSN
jgi:hypothetical protein